MITRRRRTVSERAGITVFVDALAVIVTLLSGTVAGVFFAVAISVIPALAGMPAGRYIEVHRRLGQGYHPAMPIICTAALAADVALVFLVDGVAERLLYAVAAVLVLGVQGVSHLCNVPINRQVHAIEPDAVPADWADPRELWRNWHLLRTVLAFMLTLANAIAITRVQ
jgi:uncharacterized membrane protein